MTQYTDDATITNEAKLWRRVPPWHFVLDENQGRVRPSKAAFDDDEDGSPMSVVLAEIVVASGRGPSNILIGHAGFALASISAGLVRSKNQGVVKDPRPEEPAHAVVFGKKTDSVRRAFAKQSEWVIPSPSESQSEHT
jgi:hypothetical protein